MSTSRIHAEVDFDSDGKHAGFLRIPHSVHRSAYGWLPVPVVSVKNGNGPRVLLMSGNHGDEYEGQVALSKLIAALQPDDINGQVIFLPMANYPAAYAGLRTSPIDEGNLNRSFPGDPDGSPTMMIAHFIEHLVLSRVDIMLDLHSGGSSLMYIPSVQAQFEPDGSLSPQVRELVDAFDAPISQVYAPGGEDRMSESAARRNGVVYITTELGGAGTVTRDALVVTERGLRRTLYRIGCLKSAPPEADEETTTRYVEVKGDEHYCYSREIGLFEPLVSLGDEVVAGQPAAAVHFPETPLKDPLVVEFKGEGVVICQRFPGRVVRGDCLFHLGSDWPG
jgi:predicted deacylase